MSVPHFVALRMLSYLLALRTSAELALARTDDAFADAWVLQRIAAALVQAPHLVGTMVGAAIQGGMGLQTFWEGLSRQSWSEDQLRRFQRSFTEIDLLQGLDHALRAGERAGVNHFVRQHSTMELAELFGAGPPSPGTGPWLKDLYRKAWPRGWIYQNQVVHNRLLEETAFGNYDLGKRRVYPDKCRQSAEAMNQRINAWNPFVYLAAVGIPNTPRATETVARIQTYMSEAAVACALELFRRRGGEYPPALAALAPEFIAALPHDLVTGGPLMYRRSSPVRYTLYAVGWDGKDDGGAPENAAASNNPATAMKGGDWPWPEPVTPASQ